MTYASFRFNRILSGNSVQIVAEENETEIPMGEETRIIEKISQMYLDTAVKVPPVSSALVKYDLLPISDTPYIYRANDEQTRNSMIYNWVGYDQFLKPIPPIDSRRFVAEEQLPPFELPVWIEAVLAVNPTEDNCFEKLIIEYRLNGVNLEAYISYDQFINRNLLDSFKIISIKPGKKKQGNQRLFEDICRCKWSYVSIPSVSGWHFIDYLRNEIKYRKWVFVTSRCLDVYPLTSGFQALSKRIDYSRVYSMMWLGPSFHQYVPDHPLLKTLWAFRIYSQLLGIFSMLGYENDHMLVVEPSDTVGIEYLVALMQTQSNGLNSMPLNENKRYYSDAFADINDGTVILRDTELSGKVKNVESAITAINNDIRRTNSYSHGSCRHLVTVISPFALDWFQSSEALYISFADEAIYFDCDANSILKLVREFDGCLIEAIARNEKWSYEIFHTLTSRIKDSMPEYIPMNRRSLYIAMITVYRIVNFIIKDTIFHDMDRKFLEELLCTTDTSGTHEQILNEFMTTLNERIRKGGIQVEDKKFCKQYSLKKNTAIAMDNVLGLEPSTIENMILPLMKHQIKRSRLITLLDKEGILYCPEKNHHNKRHTVSMPTGVGQFEDVHVYSINRNFLDADVRQMIDNLAHSEYLLEKNEIPDTNFLPMILCNGQIVGKKMRYEDEEDNHLSISGQTSSGKTYALAQRAAFLADLQHRLVILDAEGAFSREKLSLMLPPDFIEKNVLFRELETDGIPVDLFHLARKNGNTDKSILEGILTAGSRKLTGPQLDALRTEISNLLCVTDPGTPILPETIRKMLDKSGTAYENLKSRLYPVLDDLSEFKMEQLTWGEFFENGHPILVLSMQPAFRQSGYKLFDMLLASLYNYQVRNFETPLDIIMDEVQNQNVSESGPLWKIVTGGRKFHMSVSCATQEYVASRNDTLGSLMGKFRNKMFLSPTSDSETAVASVLGYGSKKKRMFDAMQRGDCIMKMPCYSKAIGQNHYITISGHILSYEKWLNWKE